mmetsp:Transcript_15282/g.27752  ORF Transcript_15282/g.27752 Transcript_15282/m.27752 type:complete len:356 (-) Transcript_15282:144-1211(-)|eukprot:CAMPEP_0201898578 /NCGR_PEP_ID=MMETSP0902-20130614/48756_1 /ASSEMBLY_ACC=CAM_ASM_000551 /TAXON_ID=420261 /ORGANISM="Thalassiosira antarctica, Strain CCMP982" /LENGTH=355 /DNA_ID=CAMNT_0048431773 /DNA_START=77 /DNA_END=1144 /DNA_ORIENTATION=-
MTYTSLAALIILSASGTSAFVQVIPTPQRISPLHATEAFQRSLLAARLGTNSKENGGTVAVAAPGISAAVDDKKQEQEKFQRSLLEAKFAYDAINAAIATTPTTVAAVAEPAPVEEASVVAEPEPVPEPAAPEPVAAATPEPEPEAPKPVIPEPVAVPTPKRVVKPTEFTVPREMGIVPINEATVQFTAGTLGAAAGLVLGGPILGAVIAAGFNYLSRKDEDRTTSSTSAKKVVDTASQTALLGYNFLAQFEKDNKVFDSILKLMEKAVDKAKESDSSAGDALVTLESTLGGIANKVEELNDDYDLVGGAGTLLNSVGDLVEISVDKVVGLNDEYKLTDRAGGVVQDAVGKVTEK